MRTEMSIDLEKTAGSVRGHTTLPAGREREAEALAGLLAGPAVVLLPGAPGSGKTELLRAVLDRARQEGTTVVRASADRLESAVDFGVVRQLFEHEVGDADASLSLLRGHATAAAEVFRPRQLGAAGAAPGCGDEAAVMNGLYWLALHLAGQGRLLVAVDDLQWADGASLRWLRFLLRRTDGSRVAVVATVEPSEAGGERQEILAGVLPLFRQRVVLGHLDEPAVTAVVTRLLGQAPDEEFVRACRSASGGNAFLLRTLLRTARQAGIQPVAADAARLSSLAPADVAIAARSLLDGAAAGSHAVAVAETVAVLGGTPSVDLVSGVAELPAPAVADTLHGLVRLGLLTAAGPEIGFAHPVVGSVLADQVLPSRRHELRVRAARLLWSQRAPVDEVADHLLHSASPLDEDWVNETLRRSAAEALHGGDPRRAVATLRRALREPLTERSRATLLGMLGEADLASCVPTAVRNLRHSLELSEEPDARTSAARRLAMALFATDQYAEALDVLGRTSTALRGVSDEHALRLEIDFIYAGLSELATAPSVHSRLWALDLAEARGGTAERPLAALLSLRATMRGEDPAQAVELARRALADGMTPADDESIVYNNAVFALGGAGQAQEALAYADTAVAEARDRGSVLSYAHAISTRANANCRLGRLEECRADAEAALDSLREIGIGFRTSHSVFAVTTLLEALVRQGRIDEADVLLNEAGLAGQLNGHWINEYVLLARGWLRTAQGRLDQALADFLLCGERSGLRGMTNPGFYPWRSEAALVLTALGQPEHGRALASEELRLARKWGVAEMTGVALRALGVATGGSEGRELLGEAVRVLSTAQARLRHAQALADHGAALRRASRTGEAREQLQQAVSMAHRCGATTIAEQAREELRAAGHRPRTPTFHGLEALTPTERRVTALAAEGMTNREISQHLFVGLRTVEVHLTNAYGKLGIGGRSGLAEALATGADTAP
ncbi:AAA family ATPase [Kitasatospora sp. NPDC018058]|uniref:helix-turn-helix transcriptional regulator n=1 Tax=Kitasatospora sp. NPDC018058 TaxID=3364025 RepID=UPI0037C0156D